MAFPFFMRHLILPLLLTLPLAANDSGINAAADSPLPVGAFAGEESVIRMVSEKIDITFGRETSRVHCVFVFRNTRKSGDAKQTVGFPDFIDTGGDVGRIISMRSKVNGKEVEAEIKRGHFITTMDMPRAVLGETNDLRASADFHCIDVTFPADEDVVIEREYTVENGGSVMHDTRFSYTTLTGAIWQGTIGRAEFSVTLDGWTIDDLAFEDGPQKIEPRRQATFCSVNKSEWKIESPTKMSLVWENFEPAVHLSRRGISLVTWVRPPEP
jgi:hypothetical protein